MARQDAGERRDARGAARNKREGAKARRASASATYPLDGGAMLQVAALAMAFAHEGGACRVGFTRDRGALAIGCYLGDDYATEYVRPAEMLSAAIDEIAEAWLPNGLELWRAYYDDLVGALQGK